MPETVAPAPAASATEVVPVDGAPHRLTLAHLPALDGLRGLAIVGVLLFHGGLTTGGWLGVSTFFTLSGFLITGLLLAERHSTGHTDVAGFWSRRARRLLPAGLLAITLTAALARAMGWVVESTRGDLLSSTFWVANWRFVLADRSYGELFTNPSPVQHLWSLAVEEQLYVVFPLVIVLAARWGRRGIATALGAMAVGSVLVVVVADLGYDRAYYGTDVRAAEFAAGGLLALALWRADRPGLLRPRPSATRAVEVMGALALVAGGLLWWRVGATPDWVLDGGLAAYAGLVTVPVIAAATLLVGPTARVLGWAPLVWFGTISYGLYLYHWPIFLLLTPDRVGVDGWVLFAARLGATVVVAELSFRLLERPIRRGGLLSTPGRAGAAALAGIAVTVAAVLVATTDPADPVIDFDEAEAQVAAAAPPSTVPEPGTPVVALFGDSTAVTASVGVLEWTVDTEGAALVRGVSQLGCGLAYGGERRSGSESGPYPESCARWDREWVEALETGRPDVAIVMLGSWDAYDRLLPGSDTWVAPGDPAFDEWYLTQLLGAIDRINATGAHPVWLTIPPSLAPDGLDPEALRGQAAEPPRIARLNELLDQAAAQRPGEVTVLDWAGWLVATGEDERLRPDGVHLSLATTREAADWIMPAVVDVWEARERAAASPSSTAGG